MHFFHAGDVYSTTAKNPHWRFYIESTYHIINKFLYYCAGRDCVINDEHFNVPRNAKPGKRLKKVHKLHHAVHCKAREVFTDHASCQEFDLSSGIRQTTSPVPTFLASLKTRRQSRGNLASSAVAVLQRQMCVNLHVSITRSTSGWRWQKPFHYRRQIGASLKNAAAALYLSLATTVKPYTEEGCHG